VPLTSILAILDHHERDDVLASAVALAQIDHARLTLAVITPRGPRLVRPWTRCRVAPRPPDTPQQLDRQATDRLDRATAAVPANIALTARIEPGPVDRAIRRLATYDGYDLVLLAPTLLARRRRRRRRAAAPSSGRPRLTVVSGTQPATPRPPARKRGGRR